MHLNWSQGGSNCRSCGKFVHKLDWSIGRRCTNCGIDLDLMLKIPVKNHHKNCSCSPCEEKKKIREQRKMKLRERIKLMPRDSKGRLMKRSVNI